MGTRDTRTVTEVNGSVRAALAETIVRSNAGLSNTAILHIHLGPRYDPAVYIPTNVIVCYIKQIRDDPALVGILSETWTSMYRKVRDARSPWHVVTGPATAVIAYLIRI